MTPPEHPRVYHITPVSSLESIIEDGLLYSEKALLDNGRTAGAVGMGHIKERRFKIAVPCHPGTTVGEYVPFYFCPRSVMLFLLYKSNSEDLAYRRGQECIVHLEYDFKELVSWAAANKRAWAISATNAGAYYTHFHADQSALGRIDWTAIAANDWRNAEVREHKQAEFLLYESAPWQLVKRIGVHDKAIQDQVMHLLGRGANPLVEVRPEWYY